MAMVRIAHLSEVSEAERMRESFGAPSLCVWVDGAGGVPHDVGVEAAVTLKDATREDVICPVCGDVVTRIEWVVMTLDGRDERRMIGESCLCGDRITGMIVPV